MGSLISDFNYTKTLTFDTATIGVADNQFGFPVIVHINTSSWSQADRSNFVYANLRGRRVQFFDSDETTNLAYEAYYFSNTYGAEEAIYFIYVPVVAGNSTTDYIILAYGNDPNGADQDNPTGVWDANFVAVWHMHNPASPLTDSTSNANNAAGVGTFLATGQVGKAVTFNGSTNHFHPSYIGIANGNYTISCWVSTASEAISRSMFSETDGPGNHLMGVRVHSDHKILFPTYEDGAYANVAGTSTVDDGNLHHVAVKKSSTTGYIRVDGVQENSGTVKSVASNDSIAIGTMSYAAHSSYYKGIIDELRISNIARSDDWLLLEYYSMVKTNWIGDAWLTWGTETKTARLSQSWLSGWKQRKCLVLNGTGSIAGTVAVANGYATVTGTSTVFTDWCPGDKILLPDGVYYTVDSITDATHLELTENYAGANASTQWYYMEHVNYPVRMAVMSNFDITPATQLIHRKTGALLAKAGSGWDDYGVSVGPVVPYNGGYVMLYNGWGDSAIAIGEPARIGKATSPNLIDGGTWTKATDGIGGTSRMIDPPTGFYAIWVMSIYFDTSSSTYFIVCIAARDSGRDMVDIPCDAYETWLYSTTDFVAFTELGWMFDNTDQGNSRFMTNTALVSSPGKYYGYVSTAYGDDPDQVNQKITRIEATQFYNPKEAHKTGDDAFENVWGANWVAQTFTTTDAYGLRVGRLKLSKSGAPTGDVIASIRATTAGVPSGADLADSITIPCSAISTSATWVSFRLDNLALNAATTYAIILKATSGDVSNYIKWSKDTSSGYAGGGVSLSSNSGVDWGAVSATDDCLFETIAACWSNKTDVVAPTETADPDPNTYCTYAIFDENLFRWGRNYVFSHCARTSADRKWWYFSSMLSPTGVAVTQNTFWGFMGPAVGDMVEGRSCIIVTDETALHIWADERDTTESPESQVYYYYSIPNEIVSLKGGAQFDFDDIRFVSAIDDSLLPYFLESKEDGLYAFLRVLVDRIPPAGYMARLWLTWGNPAAASASDGDSVFPDLFDHFADASLDAGLWNSGGTVVEAGTAVIIGGSVGTDYIESVATFGAGYTFLALASKVATTALAKYIKVIDAIGTTREIDIATDPATDTTLLYRDSAAAFHAGQVKIGADGRWIPLEIRRSPDGKSKFLAFNQLEYSDTAVWTTAAYFKAEVTSADVAHKTMLDWAAVCPCLPIEPTWTTNVFLDSETQELFLPVVQMDDPGIF